MFPTHSLSSTSTRRYDTALSPPFFGRCATRSCQHLTTLDTCSWSRYWVQSLGALTTLRSCSMRQIRATLSSFTVLWSSFCCLPSSLLPFDQWLLRPTLSFLHCMVLRSDCTVCNVVYRCHRTRWGGAAQDANPSRFFQTRFRWLWRRWGLLH